MDMVLGGLNQTEFRILYFWQGLQEEYIYRHKLLTYNARQFNVKLQYVYRFP